MEAEYECPWKALRVPKLLVQYHINEKEHDIAIKYYELRSLQAEEGLEVTPIPWQYLNVLEAIKCDELLLMSYPPPRPKLRRQLAVGLCNVSKIAATKQSILYDKEDLAEMREILAKLS
jgi:hypothetical protein